MTIGSRQLLLGGSALALVSLIGLSGERLAGAGRQAAPPPAPLLAEQAFKNIQALKGIPVDDFLGAMGIMTAALGFDCADCHEAAGTQNVNWAADTAKKVTARRMVGMMAAINRDNFGGRQVVTCYTCHRGRDRPLVTPSIDALYSEPALYRDDVQPPAQGQPSADQILDKYLQAIGGAQQLAAVTSWVATGTSVGFGGFGGDGQVQVYAKAPNQRSTIIEFKDAPGRDDSIRVFDGRTGWIKTPLTVLGEYQLSGSEFDGARLDAQLSFPAQIKQALTGWRVAEPTTIDDHDVAVVQGNGPRGQLVTLYFDSQSGLLVRTVRYGPSPIGRMPTQIDYADYRQVGAIKMPFRYTFGWLDGRDAFQLNAVRLNVPVEAAKFGRPSSLESKR